MDGVIEAAIGGALVGAVIVIFITGVAYVRRRWNLKDNMKGNAIVIPVVLIGLYLIVQVIDWISGL